MLTQLVIPISILSASSYGISLDSFLSRTQEYFADFSWDDYVLRQNQITLLRKTKTVQSKQMPLTEHFWEAYYFGQEDKMLTERLIYALTQDEKAALKSVKPTRRRAVSEFSLVKNGSWHIERVSAKPFAQQEALIEDSNNRDFRIGSRRFKDLPEEMIDDDLIKLIKGTSGQISQHDPSVKKMDLVVHHAEVVCYPDQQASNAPEGIHQDGMDYIVSALVISRSNISGGRSIIYDNDKSTRILEVELCPGQGILQPDKNTQLWHDVTPIQSLDDISAGSRSTLGFDFTVTQRG